MEVATHHLTDLSVAGLASYWQKRRMSMDSLTVTLSGVTDTMGGSADRGRRGE